MITRLVPRLAGYPHSIAEGGRRVEKGRDIWATNACSDFAAHPNSTNLLPAENRVQLGIMADPEKLDRSGITAEQREQIIRLLAKGEELSPEWARILFPPEKREYELVYHGKEREEEIIADTLAVPLQKVRTFGKNGVDWQNKLIFGDNLQVMKSLLEQKRAGDLCNSDGTPGARLIYIDPPFSTKQEFRGSQAQKAYQDKVVGAQFLEFLRKRLVFLRELLADDGFLVVHIDYRFGHYVKILLDELLPRGFRNDIKVPRGTKNVQNQFDEITALTVGDNSLLLYAKSSHAKLKHLRLALNSEAAGKWDTFWRGTDRKTMRYPLFGTTPNKGQWRWQKSRSRVAKANYEEYLKNFAEKEGLDEYYLRNVEDGRTLNFIRKSEEGVVQYFVPPRETRIASTMWTEVRTLGRVTGYPTEKHEELLARVVEWLTSSGDLVLDAFAGSGTTCAVAEKTGRRWIGIDCGKLAMYTMQKRMLTLRAGFGNKGDRITAKPFTLFNAGLYDFSTLKELSWDAWRFFALQLFQCRDRPHKIGGVQLDGYLKGSSVLVFNHQREPGVRIDETTIESLHEALGSKIGARMFIIAPALVFDFQQDYLTVDDVRYYALRIPYSIIHELHRREFTALKQPADELQVNDTVDAVGFDFIRRPELKYEAGVSPRKGQLLPEGFIRIKTFKSEALIREPLRRQGNRETLSMVLLDYNYNRSTDVFEHDAVFFAEALEKSDWELRFPIEALGDNLMAVFVDMYGNEAREVIPASRFGIAKQKGADHRRKVGTKKMVAV